MTARIGRIVFKQFTVGQDAVFDFQNRQPIVTPFPLSMD